jgi:DNA-binding NtrC family response regulator
LAESDTIGLSEFPQIAAQISVQPAADAAPSESGQPLVPESHAELPLAAFEIEPQTATAAAPQGPSADVLPLLDAAGEVRPLEELEAELIRYAITHYRGQMSEVARRLQIGRSTLYRKLEALGLNTEQNEADSEGVAG